jgi:hypothetical protein
VARRARPLPGCNVDLFADETRLRPALEELDQGLLRLVVESFPLRQMRERAELEHQRADLGGVRLHSARLTRLQVHVHVGHPGRRVKDRQEPVAEVLGQGEQAPVPRHLVGREKSPEDADGELEILDLNVLVERQVPQEEGLRLLRLVRQAHDEHGVEGVDRRHEERRGMPVLGRPADWLQLVMPPGIALVRLPAMEKLRANLCGERGPVERRRRRRRTARGHRPRGTQQQDDAGDEAGPHR